jgi:sodium-dependent phosphate transporter
LLHKPKELELVQDYYKGHKTKEELTGSGNPLNDLETNNPSGTATMERVECPNWDSQGESGPERVLKGKWHERKAIIAFLKRAFFYGVNIDIANEQNNPSLLCRNLEKKHAEATRFDNKAEHPFSYLQVLTVVVAFCKRHK